jgi:hypothetical protein
MSRTLREQRVELHDELESDRCPDCIEPGLPNGAGLRCGLDLRRFVPRRRLLMVQVLKTLPQPSGFGVLCGLLASRDGDPVLQVGGGRGLTQRRRSQDWSTSDSTRPGRDHVQVATYSIGTGECKK